MTKSKERGGGEVRRGDASLEANFLFLCNLFSYDGWGKKTVMSGLSFPAEGKPGGSFFSLLFLFLLLRFSSTRLWKEGSCYYNTYDFFYWGEMFFCWGSFY